MYYYYTCKIVNINSKKKNVFSWFFIWALEVAIIAIKTCFPSARMDHQRKHLIVYIKAEHTKDES